MFFFLRILMPVEFVIVGTCKLSYLVPNQLTLILCKGIAFFDSGWSRSVNSPSPGCNVRLTSPSPKGLSKVFPLRADMHGGAPGCMFEYVVPSPTPTVPGVNIDFSQWSIPSEFMASTTKIAQCCMAWGLSWLFRSSSPRSAALSIDVSAIPFIPCKRLRSMFPKSRTVVGRPGLYRRPEAQLDWCVLAFGHPLIHSLGMIVASVAFASSTDKLM